MYPWVCSMPYNYAAVPSVVDYAAVHSVVDYAAVPSVVDYAAVPDGVDYAMLSCVVKCIRHFWMYQANEKPCFCISVCSHRCVHEGP